MNHKRLVIWGVPSLRVSSNCVWVRPFSKGRCPYFDATIHHSGLMARNWDGDGDGRPFQYKKNSPGRRWRLGGILEVGEIFRFASAIFTACRSVPRIMGFRVVFVCFFWIVCEACFFLHGSMEAFDFLGFLSVENRSTCPWISPCGEMAEVWRKKCASRIQRAWRGYCSRKEPGS